MYDCNWKENGKLKLLIIVGTRPEIKMCIRDRYRHAEFIITDTFHGMIFALIYEKPFVVLKREDGGHWAKYSDRMTSTLSMLGLEAVSYTHLYSCYSGIWIKESVACYYCIYNYFCS